MTRYLSSSPKAHLESYEENIKTIDRQEIIVGKNKTIL